MRRLVTLLLALCDCAPLAGQHQSDSIRDQFVKSYPDHFYLWPVIKQRTLSFSVENSQFEDRSLNFQPNNSYSAGIGIFVFDVSVELSLAVPIDEKSQSRFGHSDARDLSTTLLGRNWGFDAFVQRYSSFYLSNPAVTIPANQPFPLRPDILLTNTGLNGIYVFNKKKFSLWSAYNFSERQIRGKGSALLAGTVNTVHLSADSVVLSSESLQLLRTSTNFRDIRYATLSIAPGYSHSFIYRNWYLNLSLSVGPAHHWVYYLDGDGVGHYDIAINSFVDSRVALGYNSDRWFGGLTFVSQARAVRFEEMIVETKSMSFRMLVGYRISESGMLKKTWRDFFPESWRKYL